MCLIYQFTIGTHMAPRSDWASLPSQLVTDAFQLQSNALDNCAAACVCKSWQSVVKSSFVSTLHLHVNGRAAMPSCLAQWCAFLTARSSTGELKLTAGGSAELSGIGNHLNPLTCIPADCKSLTLDEHFAPFIGDYTKRAAKLQHLAIKHRESSLSTDLEIYNTLGSLSHLTQLRSLRVETSESWSAVCLGYLPNSLTSLHIAGWGEDDVGIALHGPDQKRRHRRESACLKRLKDLKLHRCCVQFHIGSTANLEGLTSLSLRHSHVGRDVDAVLQLTNLESLDLTGVMISEDPPLEARQPWSKFEAWPVLHVSKFAGCWLIDGATALDIATVQLVHTDRLAAGMATASVCLFGCNRRVVVLESLASLSVWTSHLVGLHVIVTDRCGEAPYLADIANTVLEALSCLQSFHLGYDLYGHFDNYSPAQIVLGDGYSGQLKDLKLKNLYYHTLDVGVATCLTRISLNNFCYQGQHHVHCELILPSSVVRLEVVANNLTIRHAKCPLELLPCLTHVKLGVNGFEILNEPKVSNFVCMPNMPSSLQWLSVTRNSLKKLLDGSAQHCLRFCTGLEYLILPYGQYPEGELYAWVKNAQYVRISDNDPEEDLFRCWHDEYHAF